jgi:hypothetical protein
MEPSKKKEFIRALAAAAEAKREQAFKNYKIGVLYSVDYDEETIQRCERAFNHAYFTAMTNVLRALEERAEIVI